MATDGYAPNALLNNAAITGELLMGTGKSFPGFANKTLEDLEATIDDYLTGAFLIARQMDIDIVSKDPTTPIKAARVNFESTGFSLA